MKKLSDNLKYIIENASFYNQDGKDIQIIDIENFDENELILSEFFEDVNSIKLNNKDIETIPEELDLFKNLKRLYLSRNKIKKIENLDKCANLKLLYLDGNQITKIENLNKLTNLEEMSLSNNQIFKIEGIEKLKKLNKINLSNNKIKKIIGISDCISLKSLFLSNNNIKSIENLEILFDKRASTFSVVGSEELKYCKYNIEFLNNSSMSIDIKDMYIKKWNNNYIIRKEQLKMKKTSMKIKRNNFKKKIMNQNKKQINNSKIKEDLNNISFGY